MARCTVRTRSAPWPFLGWSRRPGWDPAPGRSPTWRRWSCPTSPSLDVASWLLSDALDRLRRRDRVRHGMRDAENWWQLARFTAVGASGYVVNLITFALCVHALDLDFRIAAVIAFLVAVTNNFWWNPHWTFEARAGPAGHQAARFPGVRLGAFAVN